MVASEGCTEKLKEVRKSYKYLNHANNNVLVRRTFIKTNYSKRSRPVIFDQKQGAVWLQQSERGEGQKGGKSKIKGVGQGMQVPQESL